MLSRRRNGEGRNPSTGRFLVFSKKSIMWREFRDFDSRSSSLVNNPRVFFYISIFGLVLIFEITYTSQFEIESNVNNNSNFLSTGLTYPLILNQYIHIFITEKNRIYFICLSISFFFFFTSSCFLCSRDIDAIWSNYSRTNLFPKHV